MVGVRRVMRASFGKDKGGRRGHCGSYDQGIGCPYFPQSVRGPSF